MSICLLLLVLVPLLGAAIGAVIDSPRAARIWALGVSLLTAAAAVALIPAFDFNQDLAQVPRHERLAESVQVTWWPHWGATTENRFQIEDINFQFKLGADAISLFLVLLTVGLTPLAIAASFDSIRTRQKEYYAWMLLLLAAMNGVFISRDLLLFYIFFELTLIPMFFIIGIWGGPERRYAAGKFFLFTFAGSIFTLAAVVYLGVKYGTFDIIELATRAQTGHRGMPALSDLERMWVLLGMIAGFAVKVPLFPVHTWLPLAHTEAPTAGSVILAGVLLKLGTYGLLRIAVPLGLISGSGVVFPVMIKTIAIICIIGIIYGALVAWVQQDIKKLVAYSSVSHLGFCVLGLVALNAEGMGGSVLYMINHGLSTGALFLVVGMIYDRFHTRDINELSGLARQMPRLAFFFILFTLSSIGLPGLNGFVSEFLTVLGAFVSQHLGVMYGAVAALGVILGAVYMLHMAARVIWGPLKTPASAHTDAEHHASRLPVDIGGREIAVLVPIAVLVVVLGVYPNVVLRPIEGPLQLIREPIATAPPRRQGSQRPAQQTRVIEQQQIPVADATDH
jgi:NADH-quinone oxidoreductase subunit M